jgi:hypothetical protein
MARHAARLAALAALLLPGAAARADLVTWTYNATPSTTFIQADGSPSAGVSLSNDPLVHAQGNSDVALTNLTTLSTADPSSPDKITQHGNWSVSLAITDTASGKSNTVTFTGTLGGTLSSLSAGVTNVFTGTTKFDFVLGNNEYVVTAGMYSPPGPPNASNKGSISAHVDVAPVGGGGPQKAPEPSTLLLAALGLAGAGAYRRRTR